MKPTRPADEERRRLFRRMAWVYVYAPPILAVLISVIGSAVLAFIIPLRGTTFLGRWALGVLIILVFPTVIYVVKSYLERGRR